MGSLHLEKGVPAPAGEVSAGFFRGSSRCWGLSDLTSQASRREGLEAAQTLSLGLRLWGVQLHRGVQREKPKGLLGKSFGGCDVIHGGKSSFSPNPSPQPCESQWRKHFTSSLDSVGSLAPGLAHGGGGGVS